jgi:hypothetical protein
MRAGCLGELRVESEILPGHRAGAFGCVAYFIDPGMNQLLLDRIISTIR